MVDPLQWHTSYTERYPLAAVSFEMEAKCLLLDVSIRFDVNTQTYFAIRPRYTAPIPLLLEGSTHLRANFARADMVLPAVIEACGNADHFFWSRTWAT